MKRETSTTTGSTTNRVDFLDPFCYTDSVMGNTAARSSLIEIAGICF